MAMPSVKTPEFNWKRADRVLEWRQFRTMTEIILNGPYKELADEAKVGCLINWMGIEGAELRSTWTLSEDEAKDVKHHLDRFESYMKPQSNFRLSRFKFRQKVQKPEQTIEDFVAELKIAIKDCRYRSDDEHIIDGIIFGTKERRIREKLLENDDPELTVKDALLQIKPIEASRIQSSGIEGATGYGDNMIHHVSQQSRKQIRDCKFCGKSHPSRQCPAYGTKCKTCGRNNHWASVCRSNKHRRHGKDNRERRRSRSRQRERRHSSKSRKHIRSVEQRDSDYSDSDTDSVDSVDSVNAQFKSMYYHSVENMSNDKNPCNKLFVRLPVSTKQIRSGVNFKVDTGAEGNLLPVSDYVRLFPCSKLDKFGNPINIKQNTNVKLIAFNGTEIKQYGVCSATLLHKGNRIKADFFVVKNGPAILGLPTSEKLKVITINVDTVEHMTVTMEHDDADYYNNDKERQDSKKAKTNMMHEFNDVFQGVGCFAGECTIHLDPNVPPSVSPPRRIPVALQDPVKAELESMESQGIIASLAVDEPSEWCNSFICASKSNGNLRFCLDPAKLNEAIIRPYHYTPTLEDVLPKLNGAKYFSILDARSGYWNIKLDNKSSYYTTFATPFGRYRFLRLPFGLSCSSDMFQKKIDETYGDMPQVTGIADDLVIIGYDEDGADHDRNLKAFLERTREKGIKLNPDKCIIRCTRIPFYGMVTGANGLEPDPKKIKAIVDMKPPTCVKDLQSFLGVVNYLSGFSPYVAELAAPLRKLLRTDSVFCWTPEYDRAFNAIKKEMASPKILKFFDAKKPVVLEVDSSGHGLGAALMQPSDSNNYKSLKPVAYASKTLSDAETRYANIEREMLAIVFGMERFHHYTYGRKVNVITDHKPLVAIMKKPVSSAPPRLARMLLRLQKYDINLEYSPGKELKLADALSRVDPLPGKEIQGLDLTVHEFHQEVNASVQKLDTIRGEIDKDLELQCLKNTVISGWPDTRMECPSHIVPYWNYRDEISIVDGILIKGNRIIIPKVLRAEVLDQIHYAHLGVEKCRLRARDSVFWPNINKDIAELVSQCTACQELQPNNKKEPLKPFDIPPTQWHTVASDLFFYDGENYLLLIDYYSKFPFVRKIPDITTNQVIKHMKLIFEDQGIPSKMITDSGSQYLSADFQNFSKLYAFEHIAVSPLHHQANGMVERCVQTVKRIIKKCKKSGQDLHLALLCYKTTPIDHNLPSPCELLNGRMYKSNLPSVPLAQQMKSSSAGRPHRDTIHKELTDRQNKQKYYYDRHTKPLDRLYEGQQVAIQDNKGYWTKTGVIKSVDHDRRQYIIETGNGSIYIRNRKYVRPMNVNRENMLSQYIDEPAVVYDNLVDLSKFVQPNVSDTNNRSSNKSDKRVRFQVPEKPMHVTPESSKQTVADTQRHKIPKEPVDKPSHNDIERRENISKDDKNVYTKSGRKVNEPKKMNL